MVSKVNQLFQDEQQEQFEEALAHVLMAIQAQSLILARRNNQTTGEGIITLKNDYYVTLQQLEAILMTERVWL